MKPTDLLEILETAGKLKLTMRHCWIDGIRQESTAEHSWRLALMAMLLKDEEELKDVDMDKVMEMCLIHDLGEAFTGDIPAFEKKDADTKTEVSLYEAWVESFPAAQKEHWMSLLKEMEALETKEAQVYKALDKLEALITHNESPISTWLPLEYDLQMTYGKDNMKCHPYFEKLRQAVDAWTIHKIETEKSE
jgi:putative hydrolase of HD superfamily